MERIGNHILNLDDIIHVLSDHNNAGFYAFITKSIGTIQGIKLSDEEYQELAAELGVAEPEEYPHTDVQFDGDHFVTEPQRDS